MKRLFLTLALMAVTSIAAAEGRVYDPAVDPTVTVTCAYPTERVDNSILPRADIAAVDFFVTQSLVEPINWQPAGSNTQACSQTYNLVAIPDGQYYYSAVAQDTDGRRSDNSYPPNYVAIVVQRTVANPKPPTMIDQGAGAGVDATTTGLQ